jgi:hypothetical protein
VLPVAADFKASGKREAKRSFTISIKTPNGTVENTTVKGTTEMTGPRGSARSK